MGWSVRDFISTFWLPKYGGNVYALLTLIVAQSILAWLFYRRGMWIWFGFSCVCVGANFAKIGVK
jgi:hypothetical protein